jgi:hypothetical protein
MSYALTFSSLENYDAGKVGIKVPMFLSFGGKTISLFAKVDTGSTYCIFERIYGERLGIDIEQGYRQYVGTAVGGFVVYGHEVTLSVCGFDFYSTVFFAQEESIRRNVLGRFGWLNKIRLGSIDYDGLPYLSRYDSE